MQTQTTPHPAPLPALADVLQARYSCRAYRPEPVPRDTIEQILALAQRSPSWCNSQPWQVIVTDAAATEALRAALSQPEAAQDIGTDLEPPIEYRGIYKERRRECGFQLYDAVGIERGDRVASARQADENLRFFGAPHVALVTTEAALGTYGVLDCGAYVNNFMLAARSLGVASIAQAAIAYRSSFLRRWFDIPADRQVVCGISFGFEEAGHPANGFRTHRAPMEQVLRWVEGAAAPGAQADAMLADRAREAG